MKTTRSTVTLLAALALSACGGGGSTATSHGAVLVDGRSGGTAGFFFLPPVAPEPEDATPNRLGLSPVVRIEELAPGTAGVVAAFDAVKDSGAHYQADWDASAAPLSPGQTYRISVLLSGVALGWADASVSEDGGELQFLFSQETFPLTGERTLPIKFRIAEPAPDADGDRVPDAGDDCPTVADADQLDSDEDGVGDACECLDVVCPEPPPCHAPAGCDARTGACAAAPASPDGTTCPLPEGTGVCVAGQCVAPAPAPAPAPEPAPAPTCETCGGCSGDCGTCAGTTCGGGAGGCTTCSGECCGCGTGTGGGMTGGPGMPMGGMGSP